MKFDKEIRKNYLLDFHPETLINNYEEIQAMSTIKKDDDGIVIDEFHKTLPFLTKYEKTRILGQRTKQINSGAKPYIDKSTLMENGKPIIDGYIIALKELEAKKIPFIIRRPLPNGGSEYWKLKDLEIIN
jgi:DNA-directed RNA polymerase subunit K/omega